MRFRAGLVICTLLAVLLQIGRQTPLPAQEPVRESLKMLFQNALRPLIRPNSQVPIGVVRSCAFRRLGTGVYRLAAAGQDKVVRQWEFDAATSRLNLLTPHVRWPIYTGSNGEITCVTLGPDGSLAFGGRAANALFDSAVVYVGADGRQLTLRDPEIGPAREVVSIAFHPVHANRLAVALRDSETVLLWHVPAASVMPTAATSGDATAPKCTLWQTGIAPLLDVQFADQGDRLAAIGRTGEIRLARLAFTETAPATVVDVEEFELGTPVDAFRLREDQQWTAVSGSLPLFGALQSSKQTLFNFSNLSADEYVANGESLAGRQCSRVESRTRTILERNIPFRTPSGGYYHWLINPNGQLEYVNSLTGVCRPAADTLVAAVESRELVSSRVRHYLAEWSRGGACRPLPESEFAGQVALAISDDGRLLAAIGLQNAGIVVDGQLESTAINTLKIWNLGGERQLQAEFPQRADRSLSGAALGGVRIDQNDLHFGWTRSEVQNAWEWYDSDRPHGVDASTTPRVLTRKFDMTDPAALKRIPNRAERVPQTFLWHDSGSNTFSVLALPEGIDPGRKTAGGQLIEVFDPRRESTHRFQDGRTARWWGPLRYPSSSLPPNCAAHFRLGNRSLLALATDNDIRIWDVTAPKPRCLRAFSGHEGRVNDMDFDVGNGEPAFLVSASEDGTIRCWSLEGLKNEPPTAPYRAAEFARGYRGELAIGLREERARLFVDDVFGYGLGYQAGFLAGQEIRGVAREVDGRIEQVPRVEWKSVIEQAEPGKALIVDVDWKDGQRQLQLRTEVTHGPIWTLYPMLDGEWVVWGPNGEYEASGSTVDERFGWHTNILADDEFRSRWDQVRREEYYRPLDVRNQLLRQRIPSERPAPQTIPAVVSELRTSVRRLEKPEPLHVDVEVLPALGGTLDRVEVWCNSQLLHSTEQRQFGLDIPAASLRPGTQNAVIARALTRASETAGGFLVDTATATVSVGGTARPKLHYLGVGVTVLANKGRSPALSGLQPLRYADNDAVLVGQALRERLPPTRQGLFRFLVHDSPMQSVSTSPPTRAGILQALDEIVRTAQPEDTVVVLMTGHGVIENGSFCFFTEDSSRQVPGVFERELFERLYQLPCASVLFVDACHSGGLDLERAFAGRTYSPGPLVILSSSEQQFSYERPRLHQLPDGMWRGMGLMSAAVVEGLTGRVRVSQDGELEMVTRGAAGRHPRPLDLASYVVRRVPELLATEKQLAAGQADSNNGQDRRALEEFQRARQTPVVIPSLSVPDQPLWD